MEAEKENMRMQIKPMRRLSSLRRNPENDVNIDAFMKEFFSQESSQQPLTGGNKSVEKLSARKKVINSGGLRDADSLQNQEDREDRQEPSEKYQSKAQMFGLSRRRSVQPDGLSTSDFSREGTSLQDDMNDQAYNNAFRRIGQRRRSSVLNTEGEGDVTDSKPFTSNFFKHSLRTRSKLMQSSAQSPQGQTDSWQQDSDTHGPRRRSGRLMNDISECGTSYSDVQKTQGERNVNDRSVIMEQKEGFNRIAPSQNIMKFNMKNAKPSASPLEASINNKPSRRGLMSGGKNKAFEKLQPLFEKAKEQSQMAPENSPLVGTPRMRQTPLRRGLTSAHKELLMSSKRKAGKRNRTPQDIEESDQLQNSEMSQHSVLFGRETEDNPNSRNNSTMANEDSILDNPFRRFGQRRRSSIINPQEVKPLVSNFSANFRRRSNMQNLEPITGEGESHQPELNVFGPRRRSARLTQLDEIVEKCGTSLQSSAKNVEEECEVPEKEENFNRLASYQFSKNMRLITGGTVRLKASPAVKPSSTKTTRGTFMLGRKHEELAQLAPAFEKGQEQNKMGVLKSGSKRTARMRMTSLRMGQAFGLRGGQLQLMHLQKKQEISSASSEDEVEENFDQLTKSKECCRTLQFESGDEGDDSEDITTPLEEMDITNMIVGPSILQGATEKTKESKVPVIKKSLLHISEMNLKQQTVSSAQEMSNKEIISESQDEFRSARDFESEWLQDEETLVEKNVKHKAVSNRKEPQTLNRSTGKRTMSKTPVEESKKVKFSKEKPATKIAKVKTPTFKIAKRSSKAAGSGVKPVIAKPVIKVTRTPNVRRRSRSLKKPELVQTTEAQQVDDKMIQTSPAAEKCDASTNTKIAFTCEKTLDPGLRNEVETLNKEQEEIAKEAEVVKERTAARRKRMREAGIMDSFVSTISPLKRLKTMLQDKEKYNQSTKEDSYSEEMVSLAPTNKSVQFSETSIFYDAPEMDIEHEDMKTPDTSVQECNSLNASQTHWNFLKGGNRFLQTPVSTSRKISHEPVKAEEQQEQENEEEEFVPPKSDTPGEKSPFTEMAGDCERPSLAPLTPHSRKEVSLLKLSLRKQLELLYD